MPPHLAAYEPFDTDGQDEPSFEQLQFANVHEWPSFEKMPWRFDTCKLERTSLIGQPIASIRIWDSILVRCDLSAGKFFDSGLLRNELLGCRATGVQLGESTIKDVSFQNCKLNLANFRKCKLERVVFENCILDDADFNGAKLTDVAFITCELNKTDFSGTTLVRVDMTRADIRNIRGVMSLKNVRILPEQMIDLAPLLCAEVGMTIEQ